MAGREISSTLRSLKFMQRAAQKEEKKEEEEVVCNGGFGSSASVSKKCVVILEGDPHPGAVKGRMSFQHFNPSIDKLAEELNNRSREPAAKSSDSQSGSSPSGEGSKNEERPASDTKEDHKRKISVTETEEYHFPNKSHKNLHGNQQTKASVSNKKGSNKKHEKNNWSVLRPPKSQNRRG